MIILGIDPGSRCTGYGFLAAAGSTHESAGHGVIRISGDEPHPARLETIYDELRALIQREEPDVCAIEMPVYARNAQSMLKLGRAQAAAMLAASHLDVSVIQYTPKEIKKAVTGNGNASKSQVIYMVQAILGLDDAGEEDASDALAVAVCHLHRSGQQWENPSAAEESSSSANHSGSWEQFIKDNPDRVQD